MSFVEMENGRYPAADTDGCALPTSKDTFVAHMPGVQPWRIRLSQDNARNWERVLEFSNEFSSYLHKIREARLSKADQIKAYMSFIEFMSSISFAIQYLHTRPTEDFYPHLSRENQSHESGDRESGTLSMDALIVGNSFDCNTLSKYGDLGEKKALGSMNSIQGPPLSIYHGPYSQYPDVNTTLQKFKPRSAKRKPRPYEDRQLVCHYCGATETPEWRKGPDGLRTLCNACGLQYAKRHKKPNETQPSVEPPVNGPTEKIAVKNPKESTPQLSQKRPRGRPRKDLASHFTKVQAEVTIYEHISIYTFPNAPNPS